MQESPDFSKNRIGFESYHKYNENDWNHIKLQDAYVSESNKVGSWHLIGYVSPGSTSAASVGQTTNFDYTSPDLATDGSTFTLTTVGTSGKTMWQAKNRVALNECAVSTTNVWTLTTKATSIGNSAEYTYSFFNLQNDFV